jgi:transcriptional regulator
MYIPEPYKVNDDSDARQFIKDNPFGLLITQSVETVFTTLLPVLVSENHDGSLKLKGHMAALNEQSRTGASMNCKIIFTGPHSYISPAWYPKPGVPTWNYIAVEASGMINWLDEKESIELIKSQMIMHEGEKAMNSDTDLLIRNMLDQLVCFAINVNKLEMCVKMSQDKNPDHIRSIVQGLRSTDTPIANQIAELMEQINLKHL